ncbi:MULTISPECIES: Re/Si-specific NAD(P)(+) transhydrogenase subunit alpha [Prochlorococcus]|uniref:proton-translocating NAD(P)(+) transhydrogenase n=1 Tax=Prochlorococcus marinus (strain SARG / CCMP1375 / SS120) TaxID=167539 RepID=Q7VB57_PROMA|nr:MULTISPECIES: Re/Si-specific NAD(P)(+) transhydrogenase subunit alpha [Prochlorococcus]AAQ00286.1 NAD/NADP transhydrogenase alpha subunit [Prochlorococcus marinus subsp. marinus str. CCMP1375]KGG14097.1 NAD(P) transhydrogenase alpha subunit [Prochlorococcus marinus str. LG]KGG20735.1 NAD(P) transhydrogenase alpha subunit [Prochlorococcus marinus str. SS2]KGG25136.1 NAD(P) transhydrogenase alpha subunit [Prochlorococcus marinus str. SS35]KGG33312.1 NAD(P) transhydrogenase alpha subunit [Proc
MPRILIPIEVASGETRVAATPETVKKLRSIGFVVSIEKGAGSSAGFLDESYLNVGAGIFSEEDGDSLKEIDVVLCVNCPEVEFLKKLKPSALVIGLLAPYGNNSLATCLESAGLSALSLELLPRISRAQSADVLSSQANIAGYKSVLLGASALDRYFPMLMTAAGTVQPAKVVVLGAGVAGLQAIATAKRLGAVVYVSDIRQEVKEQVESLGARFIEPPEIAEERTEAGGYARQVSEAFLEAQKKQLLEQLSEADVAICTAQVPGKKAPRLIDEEMLDGMRPGSVVVDLAVSQGGNCAGTKPGEIIFRNGVKLIGASDLPCTVPNHASALYARNLLSLITPLIKQGELILNTDDELIDGSLISKDGVIRHAQLMNLGGSK